MNAILVLAYREPEILAEAVPFYKSAGFDVFVHLDRKINLDAYASRMGDAASHCIFLEPRFSIAWAGFEMINATIALLKRALAGEYTNFTLVSDDTFPVVEPKKLARILSQQTNRIALRQVSPDETFAERYARFFYFDHPAMSLFGRAVESSHVDEHLLDVMDRLRGRIQKGKVPLKLYYGSQWWSLHRKAAEFVLASHETNADLRESFEFSAVPDEIYIQSMIGNSDHLKNVCPAPIYVDWTRNPKPYIFKEVEEFTGKLSDHHVFLRKIVAANRPLLEALKKICSGGG